VALWHLLSLDAPTVAALWTWFAARANHIALPLASPVAMALAVWILYAADRLLDARLLDARLLDARLLDARLLHTSSAPQLEARHLYHHRHRRAFLLGIAVAAAALAALLPSLDRVALHLYLLEGALLVVWFVILHATRSAHRLPKEIAVGLFFAAAIFIPTIARELGLRPALAPSAILFAALCSLNCLFIYAWEHPHNILADPPCLLPAHPTTRLALAHLHSLAATVAIAGTALAVFDPIAPRPIPAACALSALLLIALDRSRRRLSLLDLRAAADLALLTPLLLLPFLR
jgi:hypothetical protein